MALTIGLTSIFVQNQEKALDFYTNILKFVKKDDVPTGEFRWLTVASIKDENGTKLLLEPNDNLASRTYQQEIFKQGIPAAQFNVDDIEQEYTRLTQLGVTFTLKPTNIGNFTIAVIDDTCGNLVQLIEVNA